MSQIPLRQVIIISPVLQSRTLKHREIIQLAQCHTASTVGVRIYTQRVHLQSPYSWFYFMLPLHSSLCPFFSPFCSESGGTIQFVCNIVASVFCIINFAIFCLQWAFKFCNCTLIFFTVLIINISGYFFLIVFCAFHGTRLHASFRVFQEVSQCFIPLSLVVQLFNMFHVRFFHFSNLKISRDASRLGMHLQVCFG